MVIGGGYFCRRITIRWRLRWWLAFFSNKTCLRCIQFFKTCYYTLYRLQYLVNVTFPMYWETRKFTGLASLQSSPYCGCLEPNQWYSRVIAWVLAVFCHSESYSGAVVLSAYLCGIEWGTRDTNEQNRQGPARSLLVSRKARETKYSAKQVKPLPVTQ